MLLGPRKSIRASEPQTIHPTKSVLEFGPVGSDPKALVPCGRPVGSDPWGQNARRTHPGCVVFGSPGCFEEVFGCWSTCTFRMMRPLFQGWHELDLAWTKIIWGESTHADKNLLKHTKTS